MSHGNEFTISDWGHLLSKNNALKAFREIAKLERDDKDIKRFVRLWVSEGIPFSFQNAAMVYETLREWLAEELSISPKDISMTGSGRIGFSLAPKQWLKNFDRKRSDLDLFIVSERLFRDLVNEFEKWSDDYNSGSISPAASESKKYWEANLSETPRNINRGFLNDYRVPAWDEYPTFRKCKFLGERAASRLSATDKTLDFQKTSFRVYQSWDHAVDQITLNINTVINKAS